VKVFFVALKNGSGREDGKAKYRDSNIVHCQGPWRRRMRERIEKMKKTNRQICSITQGQDFYRLLYTLRIPLLTAGLSTHHYFINTSLAGAISIWVSYTYSLLAL